MALNRLKQIQTIIALIILGASLFWQGCAHHRPVRAESRPAVYTVGGSSDTLVQRWAPAFIAYEYERPYNRIGRPAVTEGIDGQNKVYIDADDPRLYFSQRTFSTDRGAYTNLIYRIHFSAVPFSLVPFHLTMGKNVGLLVVVTLDANRQPVLITSVHTCGCYKAIVPTDHLTVEAFPENWSNEPMLVYGEHLPAILSLKQAAPPRLLFHLRPGVHRVMDIEVVPKYHLINEHYRLITMDMAPMDALLELPAPDGNTSFYYDQGVLKGHVKGSVKPFETLFLSLPSWDLFVGSDKVYANPEVSGNRFYTSLKPWQREESDMWDFARFLHYWGWRI